MEPGVRRADIADGSSAWRALVGLGANIGRAFCAKTEDEDAVQAQPEKKMSSNFDVVAVNVTANRPKGTQVRYVGI